MTNIVIEKEDLDELLKLYSKAENTPMIKMTADPKQKDWATLAWEQVTVLQQKLGEKYHYNWEKNAINMKGEVIPI